MSTPLSKIPEKQREIFNVSLKNYNDIFSWASRVDDFLSPSNAALPCPEPQEYAELINQCYRAFAISTTMTMQAQIFFAEAIARIGAESVMQIMVIEANITKHLPIWREYNHRKLNDPNIRQKEQNYKKVFRKDRDKHDYSAFTNENDKNTIFHRWKLFSEGGSHNSFLQTTLSIRFVEEEDKHFMRTGIFDLNQQERHYIAQNMIVIIDTFLIVAIIIETILERHGTRLKYTLADLEEARREWLEFRSRKVIEFGMTPKQ